MYRICYRRFDAAAAAAPTLASPPTATLIAEKGDGCGTFVCIKVAIASAV